MVALEGKDRWMTEKGGGAQRCPVLLLSSLSSSSTMYSVKPNLQNIYDLRAHPLSLLNDLVFAVTQRLPNGTAYQDQKNYYNSFPQYIKVCHNGSSDPMMFCRNGSPNR